ncbi:hypothetical protein Trydic_g3350 [Trypoxylus dichotomus]
MLPCVKRENKNVADSETSSESNSVEMRSALQRFFAGFKTPSKPNMGENGIILFSLNHEQKRKHLKVDNEEADNSKLQLNSLNVFPMRFVQK